MNVQTSLLAAFAVLVAAPLSAQQHNDADRTIDGGGALLPGWHARVDRDRPMKDVKMTRLADGWQIDNGPAIVLWRDDLKASGNYSVTGTFKQVSYKGHAHGVGLVVGGKDMAGPNQVYTYFLVRGDGDFLVKTRTGNETAWVNTAWEKNAAVQVDKADGTNTNTLEIRVDKGQMIFLANGTEVFRKAATGLYTDGNFGVRLNHNLTIQVSNLAVKPLP